MFTSIGLENGDRDLLGYARVVWLFAGRKDLLSETAAQLINDKDLYVSPMVIL